MRKKLLAFLAISAGGVIAACASGDDASDVVTDGGAPDGTVPSTTIPTATSTPTSPTATAQPTSTPTSTGPGPGPGPVPDAGPIGSDAGPGACGTVGTSCDSNSGGPFGSCGFFVECEQVYDPNAPPPAPDAGDAGADGGDADMSDAGASDAAPFVDSGFLDGICRAVSFTEPEPCNDGVNHCEAGVACLMVQQECLSQQEADCICTAHPDLCGPK